MSRPIRQWKLKDISSSRSSMWDLPLTKAIRMQAPSSARTSCLSSRKSMNSNLRESSALSCLRSTSSSISKRRNSLRVRGIWGRILADSSHSTWPSSILHLAYFRHNRMWCLSIIMASQRNWRRKKYRRSRDIRSLRLIKRPMIYKLMKKWLQQQQQLLKEKCGTFDLLKIILKLTGRKVLTKVRSKINSSIIRRAQQVM